MKALVDSNFQLLQVTTHAIAKAMVVDYESADAAAGVKEWEMADLRKFDATK